jgi:hypothetical protein
MRKLVFMAVALVLALAPAAWAADDGNTKPKLDTGGVYYPNDYRDVVNSSGAGNVKGIRCTQTSAVYLEITINGGTVQTIYPDPSDTGWIPMNLRFTSSIKVRVENGNYYNNGSCTVSWALD